MAVYQFHHAETAPMFFLERISQLNLYHDVHSAALRGEKLKMVSPCCMNVCRSSLSSGKLHPN